MSTERVILKTNILIIIYIVIFTPQPAYGYIDPGSIAILLQLLLAGIAGFLVTFRHYVVSVFKTLFKKNKEKS